MLQCVVHQQVFVDYKTQKCSEALLVTCGCSCKQLLSRAEAHSYMSVTQHSRGFQDKPQTKRLMKSHPDSLIAPSRHSTACWATCWALSRVSWGTRAGASVVWQMLSLWMVSTTGKAFVSPLRDRATITASSCTLSQMAVTHRRRGDIGMPNFQSSCLHGTIREGCDLRQKRSQGHAKLQSSCFAGTNSG